MAFLPIVIAGNDTNSLPIYIWGQIKQVGPTGKSHFESEKGGEFRGRGSGNTMLAPTAIWPLDWGLPSVAQAPAGNGGAVLENQLTSYAGGGGRRAFAVGHHREPGLPSFRNGNPSAGPGQRRPVPGL